MTEDLVNGEHEVLKAYAMRWAVLAAWRADLLKRGVNTSPELHQKLLTSRVKIASGCFSACEVACELSTVESYLTSRDASSQEPKMDTWLDLLGQVMSEPEESMELLEIPAVNFHFTTCNIQGCTCEN